MSVASLTPELHRRLLQRYTSGTEPDPVGSRALAGRFSLLPMLLDWSGFFGLTAVGRVEFVTWDPPHHPEPAGDEHQRRVALAVGANRYPELEFLRPQRAPDALSCPYCDGTGQVRLDGKAAPENVVCFCGGLGWVLPAEYAAFHSNGGAT